MAPRQRGGRGRDVADPLYRAYPEIPVGQSSRAASLRARHAGEFLDLLEVGAAAGSVYLQLRSRAAKEPALPLDNHNI
jgi:hypothetical protein